MRWMANDARMGRYFSFGWRQCLGCLRVLVGCCRGAAGEVSSRGPEDKAAAQSSAAVGKPAAPAAEAAQGAGRQLSQQGAIAYTPSLPIA